MQLTRVQGACGTARSMKQMFTETGRTPVWGPVFLANSLLS